MQVFTSLDSNNRGVENKAKKTEKVQKGQSEKSSSVPTPQLSESEIREKIEQHRQKIRDKLSVSDKSRMILRKAKARQNADQIDEEVSQIEAIDEKGLSHLQDSATRQRLKNLLAAGSFNFSEKERKALEQILK